MSIRVSHADVKVLIEHKEVPTFDCKSITWNTPPYNDRPKQLQGYPSGKVSGSYTASASFTISHADWLKFQRLIPPPPQTKRYTGTITGSRPWHIWSRFYWLGTIA